MIQSKNFYDLRSNDTVRIYDEVTVKIWIAVWIDLGYIMQVVYITRYIYHNWYDEYI